MQFEKANWKPNFVYFKIIPTNLNCSIYEQLIKNILGFAHPLYSV